MDARYLLSVVRRHLLVIIAVPLIVVLATGAYFLVQPRVRSSTAIVLAHPNINQTGSTDAYVQAFQAGIKSSSVLDEVSRQTGVPVGQLSKGLTAGQSLLNSLAFSVTYSGTQRQVVVKAVPVVVARDVLESLIAPTVSDAQNQVAAAQRAVTSAQASIASYAVQTKTFVPAQDYASSTSLLSQYQVLMTQAQAVGGETAPVTAAIDEVNGVLKTLGPELGHYSALQSALGRANANLLGAQTQLAYANQQQAIISAPGGIISGEVNGVSRTKAVIKTAVPAGLVALVVIVGLFAWRDRRRVAAG